MSTRTSVIRQRALWVLAGFGLGTLLLVGRLVYLQVFESGKLSALAQAQRTKTIDLSSVRGEIVDAHGKELAVSVDAYSIYAMPREAKAFDRPKTAAALGPVLGIPALELEHRLAGPNFHWLKRQLDEGVRDRVKALKLPGIGIVRESKRIYPKGQLAATLIGFVGVDNQGLAGIENAFDKVLRGPKQKLAVQVDAYGRELLREGSHSPTETMLADGNRVVLTIDENLQAIAENELTKAVKDADALRGSVMIMEPASGNLVAFASQPTYDPNHYADYDWTQIKNWPVTDVYEPGSTMKLFTIGAALEMHRIGLDQKFACPPSIKVDGRVVSDHEAPPGIRHLTPFEIMEVSSNVGTSQIAFTMKPAEHRAALDRFGFGRATGSNITGESHGFVPKLPWRPISQATISYGQGISVTPLQLLSAASAFGNDGVRMAPRLIDKVVSAKGDLVQSFPPQNEGRVLSPDTVKHMMGMLERVVATGTGVSAGVPGYRIGGKTGTAQRISDDGRGYSSDVVASFLGFLPTVHPRYVMLCVIDRPRKIHWAASTAAPLFGRVAAEIFRQLGIQPTEPIPSGKPNAKATPHEVL